MTDHTAKNLIGRDLINLREALARARPFIAKSVVDDPSAVGSELLMRIDTLIYRHADPELDIAKMWVVGDWRAYPGMEVSMTEEEHVALSEAGTEFCRQLAALTASIVAEFPPAIEGVVVCYLQDQTSLYSPFTADRMKAEVNRLRAEAEGL
jgi:hypothetical protein